MNEMSEAARQERNQFMQAYRQRPEAKEKQKEYMRRWRAKNKDRVREYNQQYWERRAAKEGVNNGSE